MIFNLSRIHRKANRKVSNYRENVSSCRALLVCNLVLILLIGSSHQVHFKWWNVFVLHFHPSSAWWCLPPTAEAADSCTLCNLFQFEWWQISLPKCWIGKFYTGTAWASISGGRGGCVPPTFRPEVVSIGNVFILFQFIKQIYRHI